MNFLMRSTTHVYSERSSSSLSSSSLSVPEPRTDAPQGTTSGSSLETLIAEDPYAQYSPIEQFDGEIDGVGGENGGITGQNSKNDLSILAKHLDVSEEEGWITIPYSMSSTILQLIYSS